MFEIAMDKKINTQTEQTTNSRFYLLASFDCPYEKCSITRAVTNERIINPALERTYLGAN